MPSLATAFDVARLYDELRECVRANDQEGVKRVFSELVQARRPVSEILAEVKSLTKERERADTETEKPETEEKTSFTREWAVSTASSQVRPNTPAQAYRDVASASAPPAAPQIRSGAPAVEPPAIEKPAAPPAQPLWRRPPAEPTPSSVEPPPNVAASPQCPEPKPSIVEPAPSVPEPTPSIAEPTPSAPEPSRVASFLPQSAPAPAPLIPQEPASPAQRARQETAASRSEEWPSHAASRGLETSGPASQESTADPASETPAAAAAPLIAPTPAAAALPEPAPIPVEAPPAPSGLFVEISPVPNAPPTVTPPTPEPSGVDFREIIRSASGVTPSVAAETQPIRRTGDQAAAPSARPEPDYVGLEGPVSSRAGSRSCAKAGDGAERREAGDTERARAKRRAGAGRCRTGRHTGGAESDSAIRATPHCRRNRSAVVARRLAIQCRRCRLGAPLLRARRRRGQRRRGIAARRNLRPDL